LHQLVLFREGWSRIFRATGEPEGVDITANPTDSTQPIGPWVKPRATSDHYATTAPPLTPLLRQTQIHPVSRPLKRYARQPQFDTTSRHSFCEPPGRQIFAVFRKSIKTAALRSLSGFSVGRGDHLLRPKIQNFAR